MGGIYIHIPFCRKACHYCDFHFSTNLRSVNDMTQAIMKELTLRSPQHLHTVNTVYFGGGTPSLLNRQQLASIFTTLHAHYPIASNAEITLEANPEDIEAKKLSDWKELGINRLSIGVQTFDDERLAFMNRAHNRAQAITALKLAKSAGFENITADLMLAIPPEDDYFIHDLAILLNEEIRHLSIYGLTIEEKTVLGNWTRKQKFKETSEDVFEYQFLKTDEILTAAGYEHYEISNYAQPGHRSKHNSNYWTGIPYVGIGPGAHGFDGESRYYNIENNPIYIKQIHAGILPETSEQLTSSQRLNEYILTSIRTDTGISMDHIQHVFGLDFFKEKQTVIDEFAASGWIIKEGVWVKLSKKGMLLCDEISLRLAFDDDIL